jgi:AcrR family transcriptional regulator
MIVTNTQPVGSLRDRKRLAAMKRVQQIAVERFLADGFDQVTVDEIAAAADVSAMSVYRWFGTKEALVLWDEFDPPILAEVAARLEASAPLTAVRDALVTVLNDVYHRERALALDRARLIFGEPALTAAGERNGRQLRDAFASLFVARAGLAEFDARVMAGVAAALLTVAIEQWQQHDGERPLAELIIDVFSVLGGAR